MPEKHKSKKNTGFTLIELLVVIAIIGILAGIVLINVNSARLQSKYARAQEDLNQVIHAMEILYDDTGEHPNHFSADPCVNTTVNNEIFLNECEAGIACTDGFYANWNGPYLAVPVDPWGNNYLFDTDYTCRSNVPGCENVPDGTVVRAILSFGPNGIGINQYDEPDNQVMVICQ